MKMKPALFSAVLFIVLLCTACQPASQAEIDAQAERLAGPIIATWVAGRPIVTAVFPTITATATQLPTSTSSPTLLPTHTSTPTRTSTPTITPTPTPLPVAKRPCVSYYDKTNSALKYACQEGTTWETQIVDNLGAAGMYTSLAFDSHFNPHISYYDEGMGSLKYASWTGT
jgi:hypothetical protein